MSDPHSSEPTMNKLYVWEDFRCDYTCGLAFALAQTKEEAQKLVEDHYGFELGKIFWANNPPQVFEVTKKIGFGVSGGG